MATESSLQVEEDEVSIKELILGGQEWIRYLWSKRIMLVIAGMLGGSLGLLYAFLKTPQFTATTTFVVEAGDSKSRLGGLSSMAALAGIDLGGGGGGLFQGDNILELYKARKIIVETLLSAVHPDSNQLLIDRYLAFTGARESWVEQPELVALDFRLAPNTLQPQVLRLRDSVLTKVVNNIRQNVLTVDKPDKKLSIIQVDVTAPDEVFAKVFNEKLVARVNDFYIQTKTKKSADNIAILEAKVDSVRTVMSGAIQTAARASDATPNLNPTRQVQRNVPVQEAQFSAESNKLILSQLLQNLELAKMSLLQEQPLIQLVDQPVYPLKVEYLGKFKGIIIGGFLAGFLTLMCLVAVRWYRGVMTTE